MSSDVLINISGTKFEFSRSILGGNDVNARRLTRMCEDATRAGEPLVFFLDRPPESFGAILSYYQTGELHMPTTICPGRFLRELEFWEIDGQELADCCRYRLQQHCEELTARRKFLLEALAAGTVADGCCPGRLGRCMTRVWNIVDFGEQTIPAKVYFGLVFVMLLLSIGTLAYSTEPVLRRPLSKCEFLEYLSYSGHALHTSVRAILGDVNCAQKWRLFHAGYPEHLDDSDYIEEDFFEDWEYDERDPLNVLRKVNLNTTDNETATAEIDTDDYKPMDVPYLTVRIFALDVLETITIVFFTADFLVRIVTCPSRVRYFFSVINLVDCLALIGCYTHLVTVTFERHHRYHINWVHFINYLQVFRAMRFLRLFTSVRAGKVLTYSLRSNARDFVLMILLILFGISGFSTVLYFVEERTNIRSIPEAWYWAIVTMTTVGYGDVTPKSGLGRLLASVCAICGVLFLAVALPLFVNNFLTLYQYSNVDKSMTTREETHEDRDTYNSKQKLNGTNRVAQSPDQNASA